MARTVTLYRPVDAFVNESTPGVNTDDLKLRTLKMKATGSTDERRAFLWFKLPFDLKENIATNITIVTATLKLRTASAWPASSTISAKRVTASWKEAGITWTNAPGVGSGTSTSPTFSGDGTAVDIDVSTIVSEAVTNKGWFGIRLTTGVTALHLLHAAESLTDGYQAKLVLTWTHKPPSPHNLSPSNGGAVGSATPTFTWDFKGSDNYTDQSEYRIQVDDDSAFGSPAWNPGYVTSTGESAVYAGSALAAGTTYYWRVSCKDTDGRESDYSNTQSFVYDTKGALSITNPAAPASNFVEEISPPITWSFTGETQRAYRVYLYRKVTGDFEEIYNSGWTASATGSHTIPERDPESRDRLIRKTGVDEYRVTVQVWDTKGREGTPGDPIWVEASRDFEFRQTAGVTAPTGLTAVGYGVHAVQLDWARTTAPDYWAVIVDGDRVRSRLTASETFVSGTSYRWIYRGAEPLRTHTYEVEAVVLTSGVYKHSPSNPTTTYKLEPEGIWLFDEDYDTPVKLFGQSPPSLHVGSEETIFAPVGKKAPVLVRQTIRGYEGTVTGQIRKTTVPNLGPQDYLDNLFLLKKRAMDREIRLMIAANRINIPIIIGKIDVSPLPDPTTANAGSGFTVTIEVAQTGKFPV